MIITFCLFYAANSDYNPLVNEVVTFTSTSLQRQCVDIGIIDDALVEPIEQFVVRLTQLEIQQEDEAMISITDNDGKLSRDKEICLHSQEDQI